MTDIDKSKIDELWEGYVVASKILREAEKALSQALRGTTDTEIVEVLRPGLHRPETRSLTLGIVGKLEVEQRKALLPDILAIASYSNGLTHYARDLVLALPRDWLLLTIEEAAEPLLSREGYNGFPSNVYEEFSCLLWLYEELDPGLEERLAMRAASHPDPDVQEVGQHWMKTRNRSGQTVLDPLSHDK